MSHQLTEETNSSRFLAGRRVVLIAVMEAYAVLEAPTPHSFLIFGASTSSLVVGVKGEENVKGIKDFTKALTKRCFLIGSGSHKTFTLLSRLISVEKGDIRIIETRGGILILVT